MILTLQASLWYAFFLVILAVGSFTLLVVEWIWLANNTAYSVFVSRVDIVVAVLFLTDFIAGAIATGRREQGTYWRHNWLNLVSSIPLSTEFTQTLRLLRIFRAVRVIRVAANATFAADRLRSTARSPRV